MNRTVAILSVAGVLFIGLAALSTQLDNFNASADASILNVLHGITNVSFLVMGFVGVFVGAIVLLIVAIAAMGGR